MKESKEKIEEQIRSEPMPKINYEQLFELLNQIDDINEVAIKFLERINEMDSNNLISVLKQERNLVGDAIDLLSEIQEELKA